MKNWQKVLGVITPGGDPCWKCPVCGKSEHVYGVETRYSYSTMCDNCGEKLKYPWEEDKE